VWARAILATLAGLIALFGKVDASVIDATLSVLETISGELRGAENVNVLNCPCDIDRPSTRCNLSELRLSFIARLDPRNNRARAGRSMRRCPSSASTMPATAMSRIGSISMAADFLKHWGSDIEPVIRSSRCLNIPMGRSIRSSGGCPISMRGSGKFVKGTLPAFGLRLPTPCLSVRSNCQSSARSRNSTTGPCAAQVQTRAPLDGFDPLDGMFAGCVDALRTCRG
jgi:hypothetical protein